MSFGTVLTHFPANFEIPENGTVNGRFWYPSTVAVFVQQKVCSYKELLFLKKLFFQQFLTIIKMIALILVQSFRFSPLPTPVLFLLLKLNLTKDNQLF